MLEDDRSCYQQALRKMDEISQQSMSRSQAA